VSRALDRTLAVGLASFVTSSRAVLVIAGGTLTEDRCDEQTPHCAKCLKSKRPCHWETAAPKDDSVVKFIIYGDTLKREPSLFPGLTQSERRSLDHFQQRTALEIPGPFRSELWSIILPRVAQHEPAVRHAILALSTMHESYATHDQHHSMMLSDWSLHHYSKALRLAVRISDPCQSFDALLLNSLVFCALDSIRGQLDQSLQHAVAGIRIMARGRDSLAVPAIPDHILPQVFLALQTQAMELGDLRVFRANSGPAQTFPPLPDRFDSTEDAFCSMQVIINKMILFFDRFQDTSKRLVFIPPEVPEALLPEFKSILAQFRHWNNAIDQVNISDRADSNQSMACLLLKMYQSALMIILTTLEHSIPDIDPFQADVKAILKLIEIFLQSQCDFAGIASNREENPSRSETTRQQKIFSMSLGVIPLLFEIAIKTRSYEIRNESMRLLTSCNRREGVWDSKAAMRLAKRFIQLQDHLHTVTAATAPPWRITMTDITFSAETDLAFKYAIVPILPHRRFLDTLWLTGVNGRCLFHHNIDFSSASSSISKSNGSHS
jgi:hypothetical protein